MDYQTCWKSIALKPVTINFLCNFIITLVYFDNFLSIQFRLIDVIDSEKSNNMVIVSESKITADIEKVLVFGTHYPQKLLVILMDKKEN